MEPSTSLGENTTGNGESSTKSQKRDYQKLASLATSVGSLSGLYCIVIICTSTVFILTNFVQKQSPSSPRSPSAVIYTQVLMILMYGIGTLFTWLAYGYFHFLKRRLRREAEQKRISPKPENNSAFVIDSASIADSGVTSGRKTLMTSVEIKEHFEQKPILAFNAEGVSFFSRMGLIGFGLGTSLLDGVRMMQYIENPLAVECYGWLYFASSGLNIFFLWAEMFFILKHHQIVINIHHVPMMFGFAHLIAANLSTWIITVVIEGGLSIIHLQHNNSDHDDTVDMMGCRRPSTIYDAASPYLYPFAIEFSLLSAAIVYRIAKNIGILVIPKGKPISQEDQEEGEIDQVDCHRSHTGLYYGFIVFAAIVCSTCLYIYYDTTEDISTHALDILAYSGITIGNIPITHFIYMVTALIASSLSILVLIPTFSKLHQMRYVQPKSLLDQHLLIVALVGYYMLFGLVTIPAITELGLDNGDHETARLLVGLCFVEFAQVTLQVIVIIHGLRRRAHSNAQEKEKPGRSLLSFLVIVNMGMWILNTFLLKGLHGLTIITNFYGEDAWVILMHIFLPLSIFYRFHAAVCFADIWSNAYTREEHCTITFSEVAKHAEDETHF